MTRRAVFFAAGIAIALGSRSAAACPMCPRDPCDRVAVPKDHECFKCSASSDDTSCPDSAAEEGFEQLCKPFYEETRWCRKAPCTEATLAKLDRSRCRLIVTLRPVDDAVSYPMHDEICRSYKDVQLAAKMNFGRRIICLKEGVASPLSENPTAEELARDCVKGVEEDCGRRCDLGQPNACATLGEMYAEGFGVGKDGDKATYSYTRACELGSREACLQGGNHEWKIGEAERNATPPDRTWDGHRAAWLFETACRRGSIDACRLLATMHCQGLGVPASCEPAMSFLTYACDGATCPSVAECSHCAPPQPRPHASSKPPLVAPVPDPQIPAGPPPGCGRCSFSPRERARSQLLWLVLLLSAAFAARSTRCRPGPR